MNALRYWRTRNRRYLCAYCNEIVRPRDQDAVHNTFGCWCHQGCQFKATGRLVLRMRRFAWLQLLAADSKEGT